eukprot:1156463-Prorocentrum_minimum.AAC.1
MNKNVPPKRGPRTPQRAHLEEGGHVHVLGHDLLRLRPLLPLLRPLPRGLRGVGGQGGHQRTRTEVLQRGVGPPRPLRRPVPGAAWYRERAARPPPPTPSGVGAPGGARHGDLAVGLGGERAPGEAALRVRAACHELHLFETTTRGTCGTVSSERRRRSRRDVRRITDTRLAGVEGV